MTPTRVDVRRSFVLIAVLVVVGSALLVATSLLFLAQSQATSAAGAADVAQSRASAWSGLQAVMTRLSDQRAKILEGELPQLDPQYTVYETPRRLGVCRVLPMNRAGDRLVAEAGRLDLNSADAAALTHTGMLDPSAAAAIIDYRDQTLRRPIQSICELLNAPGAGITAEKLYGPIEDIKPMNDAQLQRGDVGQRIAARLNIQTVRGLADVLTVYAFEPSLQGNGKLRINLNVPWSEELGARVAERFGQSAADLLKKAYDKGAKFDNEAKLFQMLRAFKLPPEDWPPIVDAFTADGDEVHFGRLDINTAPYEALLALPGMTAEQAAQIVRVREQLSAEQRATIVWPLIAQIVAPEAYDQLAGKITTRSWTFRVRLAAGEVDADQPESEIANPVIYEAVIDLSAPRAHLAYLRDISVLQSVAQDVAAQAANGSLDQMPDFDRSSALAADEQPRVSDNVSATSPDDRTTRTTANGPDNSAKMGDPSNTAKPATPSPGAGPPPASDSSEPQSRRKIGRWLSGG